MTKIHWDIDTIIRSLVSRSMKPMENNRFITLGLDLDNIILEFNKIKDTVEARLETKCLHRYYLSDRAIGGFYFRNYLEKSYKGNRRVNEHKGIAEVERYVPFAATELSKHLDITYNKFGLEIDDIITIACHKEDYIVSTDKDFIFESSVINPFNYNLNKADKTAMFKLMLLGDKADNIAGVMGVGEVIASNLLSLNVDIASKAFITIAKKQKVEDILSETTRFGIHTKYPDRIKHIYSLYNMDYDMVYNLLNPINETKYEEVDNDNYKLHLLNKTLLINSKTYNIHNITTTKG